MVLHVPNEEDKKRTYTLDEVEAWAAAQKLKPAAVAAADEDEFAEFQRWKAQQAKGRGPEMVQHQIQCLDCGKFFKNEGGLRLHRAKIHPDEVALAALQKT